MEQPRVSKLDVVRRTDSTSAPGVPKRPGLMRGDSAQDEALKWIEQEVARAFTQNVTEAEAKALLEWYIDALLDQMRINDQRGAFDTSLEIFRITQRAEEGEHAEFMANFTKENLSDYTDTKRKLTKLIEYQLAEILEKPLLIEHKGILEKAINRFFNRQQVRS
jgi:hypothetical protein